MDAPIRVGVIGVGTMGSHHAGNLGGSQVSGAVLKAVMDLDGDLRAAVAHRHGVDLQFNQTRAIIGHSEVDALLVAAPDGLHAELAIECLEAGKPVFLEKPLATTVPDAERVVELGVFEGVDASAGRLSFPTDDPGNFLRLAYSFVGEDKIRRAIARLGVAYKRYKQADNPA